jgi:phosphatidylinositol glycan class U
MNRKQPLFVITCLVGIFAIFQPYPSIADSSLFLAMLPLYRHVLPRTSLFLIPHASEANLLFSVMRYTFFTASTLLYATLLGPAFYYLWIYAGSGNANFFYAITLVWSLGLSVLVADLLFAVLRDEWEVERPEMKGKEVRQI